MTGRKWTGVVLAVLAITSCRTDGPKPNAEAGGGRVQSAGVAMAPAAPSRRLVFPWSIVSGGVDSPLAMRTAMQEDPVVEAHYAGLNPAAFRAETLPAKRQGYVSYRLRDKVYWTRGMVTLLAGETVLSDGRFLVRGRCGNLISPTPRQPVAPPGVEPEEIAMNMAVREALLMHSPALPVEIAVETEKILNPKQIGNDREITSVLPAPDPREMMPPVWTTGEISSPEGGLVAIGGVSGAAQSSPGSPTAVAPPESPKPGVPFVPVLTRSAPVELPPPMVIATLVPPLETPIVTPFPATPGYVWEHPPPNGYPPGVPPIPPGAPPQVHYPPGESPPPTNTPPGTPPPQTPPPPALPPSGPPPFDPPSSPPPGPPPPDMPVPEPGVWVLLALGLAGIAARYIRRDS